MWKIGNIEIKNEIVLAPMAGITTPAYMRICADMGAGYAVTELLSAEAIVRGNTKTFDMLNGLEKVNIPVAIQIFGSNPKTMAEAAKILVQEHGAKIIDINMGCPVPKVAIKNGAGSALLKNPDQIRKIVTTVVQAVNVPVTVKIRSGWDDESINAVEVAKICEECGAKAIAIHARTRSQGYGGRANWQIIKDVAHTVKIPVIGNGDVKSGEDAKRMITETGCTAVMIGRGLLGNPWLVKECLLYLEKGIKLDPVLPHEKIKMMLMHLKELQKEKDERTAVLEMRTHFLHYLNGLPENKKIKNTLCQAKSTQEIETILRNYDRMISS